MATGLGLCLGCYNHGVIAVIGAGVTGLATAIALRERGVGDVAVFERNARPGQEASTHNSGVIHAGLYYPPGSLKAHLCVEGRGLIYDFCSRFEVRHVRCGKLIVSVEPDEERGLDTIAANAAACGVRTDLVSRACIQQREPHIRASRGLWVPDTGWLDASEYVAALTARAGSLGVHMLYSSPVVEGRVTDDGLELVTPRECVAVDIVINAAGVYADTISARFGAEPFIIHPCRGRYALLGPRARDLVKGLVYPVPVSAGHGLGVHLMRTLDGDVLAGPTIEYQASKHDTQTGRAQKGSLLNPIRRFLPSVELADLRDGPAGIRAKLNGPDVPFADFMIQWDAQVPRLLQLAGIDSPGLTASLAIGRLAARMVADRV